LSKRLCTFPSDAFVQLGERAAIRLGHASESSVHQLGELFV
jgi:hypothetical protein